MSLINAQHDNDLLSAALSLANNRAEKVLKVRANGHHEVADRYARYLFDDVRNFIAFEYAQKAHGEQVSDNVCEQLHAAVARARGEAP